MTEQERAQRLSRLAQELAELIADAERRNDHAQQMVVRLTALDEELARVKELVVHLLAERERGA